jgi:AraC-like DNA-binding protein
MNKRLQKTADSEIDGLLPIEVLNQDNAKQRYSLKMYQASDELKMLVEEYWILDWQLAAGESFTCQIVPSSYTNLTFMPEGARITGVTTGLYSYELRGLGRIVGAKFRPGGIHPFLGRSVHEITDKFIDGELIFPEINEKFCKQVLDVSEEKALKMIEKMLLDFEPKVDKNILLIEKIIERLNDNIHMSIADLVKEFGLSERSIQNLFRKYVGVGVKWIMRRKRLQLAAKLAAESKTPDWTSLAYELGYSDQSHFVNDFKATIGITPSRYLKHISAKTKSDEHEVA